MTPEFEQYRIGQAEAWLSKVRKLVGYERAMRTAADVQFEMADGLRGMDYSRIQVAVSPSPDAIPNAVAAHIDAGNWLVDIADDAKRRIEQATAAIDAMDDKTEAALLTGYFIACKTWRQVSDMLGMSYDNVMKLRRRALCDLYDYMPFNEREPMTPAI